MRGYFTNFTFITILSCVIGFHKMNFLVIFALLLAASPAISVRWLPGPVLGHDRVYWGKGCDFNGNDLRSVVGFEEKDCGQLCLNESQCTHFTFGGDRCYLKRSLDDFRPKEENKDDICGFVTPRSSQVSYF